MIRTLLILLLPAALNAQAFVYKGFYTDHDNAVAAAFVLGYNEHGVWGGTVGQSGASIYSAFAAGSEVYIKSYTGYGDHLAEADSVWPDMLVVMPVGNNSFVFALDADSLTTTMVLVGAGDAHNVTAYEIEFFGPDPYGGNASSFSAGYIAGQLAFIRDSLGCSWWEARYRARMTASSGGIFHATDGYGRIDVLAAINYGGAIPADPYPRSLPLNVFHVRAYLTPRPAWFKTDSPE